MALTKNCKICDKPIKRAFGYYVYFNDEGKRWSHPLCNECAAMSTKVLTTMRRIKK